MLEEKTAPRPLTHDAWFSTIRGIGGEVLASVITQLKDHTFFAEIRIKIGDRILALDARPSDAVAIAYKAEKPLFVDREVFEDAVAP